MFTTKNVSIQLQKHFRWTMLEPNSWYSWQKTQLELKVARPASIAPPCHTKYCPSSGQCTRTLQVVVDFARLSSSRCSLFCIPGNCVLPPIGKQRCWLKFERSWKPLWLTITNSIKNLSRCLMFVNRTFAGVHNWTQEWRTSQNVDV